LQLSRLCLHSKHAAAAAAGVEHMYVHVVADNAPAHSLYLSLGYQQEAEEAEAFAHALRRPRRLLLHKQLV
jgi:tmRNA-binding protein